ncbi:hypothetical protein ZIOFF_024671 [Zingiber officinale]|uniref:3-hydroxyisobutyryl-CoA hydrolase n=1 Tax=Zingiber officinale TaxID=94328 RepID=A0A8J5LDP1_ZINOF|nr:hypothetical protein ZIOFF_024671 [Zingiber officinale]
MLAHVRPKRSRIPHSPALTLPSSSRCRRSPTSSAVQALLPHSVLFFTTQSIPSQRPPSVGHRILSRRSVFLSDIAGRSSSLISQKDRLFRYLELSNLTFGRIEYLADMQRFKALAQVRRSISTIYRPLFTTTRPISTHDNQPHKEVLVEGKASARAAILNRPSNLNALTTNMATRLKKLYESWEDNPDIGFVIMKGSGRAFCAGGDVVTLYHLINEGKVEDCKDFFRNLYMFIYILGTYLKPHVAILDGITMGGGAGISFPGTFRVATDKTIFSTPEIHIGFHPDAGASFYLSHLTGYIGEYLALTGERLNGIDMLAVGLATHYTMSARLNWLDERLAKLVTDDPSTIDASLATFGDIVYPDKNSIVNSVPVCHHLVQFSCVGPDPFTFVPLWIRDGPSKVNIYCLLRARLELIDKCFGHETVEEILDALEIEAARSKQEWCIVALKKLKEASPLSLKVALRSIREGRFQTLDECLVREYRMSHHGISKPLSHDFLEGVRARLVDKDFTPKWDPPTLDKVSEDMVDHYFSPLGELDSELKLPTHLREAFI